MSRKTLRAFLYQNENPTIEQAWDAAWKHAQKTFHARSMRDMEKQIADLQAERERLLEEVMRLRVAMAKAAQRADDWPDSNDDPADVLSDCASILFDAIDYRQ